MRRTLGMEKLANQSMSTSEIGHRKGGGVPKLVLTRGRRGRRSGDNGTRRDNIFFNIVGKRRSFIAVESIQKEEQKDTGSPSPRSRFAIIKYRFRWDPKKGRGLQRQSSRRPATFIRPEEGMFPLWVGLDLGISEGREKGYQEKKNSVSRVGLNRYSTGTFIFPIRRRREIRDR